MKEKTAFRKPAIIVLSILSLLLVIINVYIAINLGEDILESVDEEERIEKKEKVEDWKLEIENQYLKKSCGNLPSENSIVIENTKVSRYEEPIPINTDINPYPEHTTVYEVGTITSIDLNDLDEQKDKLRLYRIEVNEDPTIYIEYISSKKEKFSDSLYIVKDKHENNFLLYPLGSRVNERYYISISTTVYE